MKQHPILFSTPMVRAILAGAKTQTRRIVKDKTALQWLGEAMFTPEFVANPENNLCPYGKPGDVLWVRETWCDYNNGYDKEHKHLMSAEPHYLYRADCEIFETAKIWRPSIFMPKAACRIWLEITDVRVERLQDISEADAVAEGITGGGTWENAPTVQYSELWEKINGTGSWNANPWVWKISFKRIAKPI